MSDILSKVRKLNWLLQESPRGTFSFNEMSEILSNLLDSNVYVVNTKGEILGVAIVIEEDRTTYINDETGREQFSAATNAAFMKYNDTISNLTGDDVVRVFGEEAIDTTEKLHTLVPILGGGKRWGTLVLCRYNQSYEDEDLVLSEYGASVIGLEIQRRKSEEEEAHERKRSMVRMAFGTLSYSEVEAVKQIFAELDGEEGLLVASKIADRSGITRSVIVNALRKLESAGVIESRSLGMKGTRIKILNSCCKEELAKISL